MSTASDEDFVSRFFAGPNTVWPGQEPNAPVAGSLRLFLAALGPKGECPLVVPRREAAWPAACYYVICWDTAHAGRIRALLEAAVADHWASFDGRVAHLNAADPVDAAVLDLAGPGTTYVLRPTASTARGTYTALSRLVRLLSDAPLRRPNLPRPIGRMLREFDVALATGEADESAQILHEIEALGGISHENVAFLQVRRLARLGRDADLLAHGSLPTLVYAEPPRLVREGILGAWARINLPRPVRESDVERAIADIQAAKPDVAMMVDGRLADASDPDVVTMCALVAVARQDADLMLALTSNALVDAAVRSLLVVEDGSNPAGEPVRVEASKPQLASDDVGQVGPVSWTDWVRAVSGGSARLVDGDDFSSWAPAWSVDAELAGAIDGLSELATDDLLSGVAGFLESDDLDRPAAKTAEALLRRYLLAERFAPHDLGAIRSLLAVFLRGAPQTARYNEVLGDLRAYASQWVAPATAWRALDIADCVALGPVANSAERADFVATVLGPLNQQKRRLSGALRGLAGLVTAEVGLDFDWTLVEAIDEEPSTLEQEFAARILLYSLEEGTLARVQRTIEMNWPRAVVQVSADHVGNPTLRQHARSADLIVVATRRAAHAATGFIADNAERALVRYPDGAGSASMLRAVESGLAELIQ